MSRSNKKPQSQVGDTIDDDEKLQQQLIPKALIGGGVPKQEAWDDYSDSVYKSLLRMAAAKDLKKSKKKKEHQKTKVGAIRITKIAIQDIETTLEKTRSLHKIKVPAVGAGRKSHAEHAILFYEHIKERLEGRLAKLQNTPTDSSGNFKITKKSNSPKADLDTFQDYYDIIPPTHAPAVSVAAAVVVPVKSSAKVTSNRADSLSPTRSRNNKGHANSTEAAAVATNTASSTRKNDNLQIAPTYNNDSRRSLGGGISTRRQLVQMEEQHNSVEEPSTDIVPNDQQHISEINATTPGTKLSPILSPRRTVVIRHPKDHRDELGLSGGHGNLCVVCLEAVLLTGEESMKSSDTVNEETTTKPERISEDRNSKHNDNEDDDNDEVVADIKNGMAPLVCCECSSHFHLKCVRPAIENIPKECLEQKWKCSYCVIQQEPKNSSARRYAAKGVRLMARLRNRFERCKHQQQQTQAPDLLTSDKDFQTKNDIDDSGKVTSPLSDTCQTQKTVTQIDDNNTSNAIVASSEIESLATAPVLLQIDSIPKPQPTLEEGSNKFASNPLGDVASGYENSAMTDKICDDKQVTNSLESEMLNDIRDNVSEQKQINEGEDADKVRHGNPDAESINLVPSEAENVAEVNAEQLQNNDILISETRSSINTSKKRAAVELSKLCESSILTPMTAKRIKKRPVLYDPQVCPASSWKSDSVADFGISGDDDYEEQMGTLSSILESASNLDAVKISPVEVEKSDTMPTNPSNVTLDRSGSNRVDKKYGKVRNKNSISFCTFCRDDPDIVVCCFCSCRVCFGKHNQAMLLLCDNCDDEYHTYCLQPPLLTIPATKWFCPSCSAIDEETTAEEQLTQSSALQKSPRVAKSSTRSSNETTDTRASGSPRRQSVADKKSNATRNQIMGSQATKNLNYQEASRKENEDKRNSRTAKKLDNGGITDCSATMKAPGKAKTVVAEQSQGPTSTVVQQPRKRGRPAKAARFANPSSDNGSSSTNPIATASLSKSTTISEDRLQSTTETIESTPKTSSTPAVLVSRSGRMVKRTNFHDEINDWEQHLRVPLRGTGSDPTRSPGSMAPNVGMDTPSNLSLKASNKRNANRVGLDTTSSRGNKTKRKKERNLQAVIVQEENTNKSQNNNENTTLYPNESASSPTESAVFQTATEILTSEEDDVLGLDFVNSLPLSAADMDIADDILLQQVHSEMSVDMHIDEDEVELLSSLEASGVLNNQVDALLTTESMQAGQPENDRKPEASRSIYEVKLDGNMNETPFAGTINTHSASIAASVAIEDTRESLESTKLPRRKPGARECMQISRKFGVGEIPQKYMDILLDYCSRGKVEHLIRMRERLDEHARFLESQLAGLESLVLINGESDVVVPIASAQIDDKGDSSNADSFV